MKKILLLKFIFLGATILSIFYYLRQEASLLSTSNSDNSPLIVGLSADYPPFEFLLRDQIIGVSVFLAHAIAYELDREVQIMDMSFPFLLPALSSGKIDLIISSLNSTPERERFFDFSTPYYYSSFVFLCRSESPCSMKEESTYQRTGVQMGSTMEVWAKRKLPQSASIIAMDSTNQLIEALKAKQLNSIILENIQAELYTQTHPQLFITHLLEESDSSPYQVVMKKNSPYKEIINQVIQKIEKSDAPIAQVIADSINLLRKHIHSH